ncbi:DNA polymerase III epsilon subunit-like protein [Streptomyces sp. HB372]|nr:DNA polymerase III epsilon subunit-like protein [Streptomyces sp. HB372]
MDNAPASVGRHRAGFDAFATAQLLTAMADRYPS